MDQAMNRSSAEPITDPTTHARIALVTGGSRGLGLALARALARKKWWLVLDARGEKALGAARNELSALTRVIAIPGDVTDPQHRVSLLEAVRSMGGLDVLVNNASMLGPSPLPELMDYPIPELEQVFRVNAIAPLALVQMLRYEFRNNARILNISSDAGVESYPGWGGYGSSKAAFEQISAVLAVENSSLRVYWVDPGDMRTQMNQDANPGQDINGLPPPEESVPGLLELIEGNLPSGRYKARELRSRSNATNGVEHQKSDGAGAAV